MPERSHFGPDFLGVHASHEQLPPSALLANMRESQRAGVRHAMCSDHFAPFSERQGQSGFAWAWLGAALAATDLTFGTVTAPGQRYHPAVIAQAAATLAEMFPERFWLALGSGEFLNEHITGDAWPDKPVRQARLRACVDVMRRLFAGETVSQQGLIHVDAARLHTCPDVPPPLFGAAVSVASAAWVGEWADGLVTVNRPHDELARVVDAFRGRAGADKPMYLQVHLSLDADEEAALAEAHDQWRMAALPSEQLWDTRLPSEVDAASGDITPDAVRPFVRVSARLEDQLQALAEDRALGFERVYLHQVPRDQSRLMRGLRAQFMRA